MTVSVYLWLPKGSNAGHSSMAIDPDTYISLWPDKARKGFTGSILWSLNVNVVRRPFYQNYEFDRQKEGFDPLIIELTTLNEDAIKDYWEKVQLSEIAYKLTDFNCSTIIANALYIGSRLQPSFRPLAEVDDYLGTGIPLGKIEAWEPKSILQYAKEIKRAKG